MKLIGIILFSVYLSAYSVPESILESVAKADNPVFIAPDKKLGENEIYFSVEIPAGSTSKFEMRTATGQVILDRELCPRAVPGKKKNVTGFPANYGFSAGKFNVDLDPVDLLVLGGDKKFAKMVANNSVKPVPVRIIGLVKMEECDSVPCSEEQWEQDWKVLAVDPSDAQFGRIKTAKYAPKSTIETIDEFFSHYKGLKNGHPQTRVVGFAEQTAGVKFAAKFKTFKRTDYDRIVASCTSLYSSLRAKLARMQDTPPVDKSFVTCLQQVWPKELLADAKTIQKFMRYAAYQILLQKLDQPKSSISKSVELMDQLRKKGSTYYRFVSYDKPTQERRYASNGSGNPIYEWVKTKNRNSGCPKDFPPQHYSDAPIVDL